MKQLDAVRVVQLLTPGRAFDGADAVMREPRVGDQGTIVHVHYQDAEPALYTVEAVEPGGLTLWVADFSAEELALVAGSTQ